MTSILSTKPLYEGWLSLLLARLRFANGEEADRHIVLLGRAVAILPYDRDRGVALVVSMPRAPVLLTGQTDMLEAIAGGLESDDPQECARREALEEAGVQLGDLHHIGSIWSMPSNATETIDYYLAAYSASDRIATGGGLDHEHEFITVHEVPLLDLWQAYQGKTLQDGKLITLILALRAEHPELFMHPE